MGLQFSCFFPAAGSKFCALQSNPGSQVEFGRKEGAAQGSSFLTENLPSVWSWS